MPSGVPEPMKTLWRRGAAKLRSPRRPAAASVAAETAIRNLRRERFAMTEKIVADGAERAPVKRMWLHKSRSARRTARPIHYRCSVPHLCDLFLSQRWESTNSNSHAFPPLFSLLPSQGKDHIHRGFYFNRLAVEQVGPVAPALHGVQRGLLQHRRTARHAQILDGSCLGDGGRQDHRAFSARGYGDRRIDRRRHMDQQPFFNRGRDAHRSLDLRTDDGRHSPTAKNIAGVIWTDRSLLHGQVVPAGPRFRFARYDDNGRNQPWRLKWVNSIVGGDSDHAHRLLRWWLRSRRRRRHIHQERDCLARQRLRVDERNQDQRKQDGAVEGEGRDHPAAAAGADSARGFERGVFKRSEERRGGE